MATPVLMPKQGNSVEECLLATWHKQAGEQVEEAEVVAEIETDKATFEVSAPVSGELLAHFCEEGDLVPVLQNICVIGEAGEDVEAFRPSADAESEEEGGATAAAARETESQQEQGATSESTSQGTAIAASGTGNPVSPRARRFAHEHPIKFQPSKLQGSGPNGRVIESDVRQAYHEGVTVTESAEVSKPSVPAPAASPAGAEGEDLSNIRKIIASRMMDSLQGTAQYTLNAKADATALLKTRKKIKVQRERFGLANITIGDLVLFSVIKALKLHPELNAELIDDKLYKHQDINVGFACDTPRGLMVPVVHGCESKSISQISEDVKSLAEAAVAGSVSPDALEGGTFTVSNLGNLGVTSFTPVINTPQVAVLGVGAVEPCPERDTDGNVVFVDKVHLSLTCDHRVVDGAPGARFLKDLCGIIVNFDVACLI